MLDISSFIGIREQIEGLDDLDFTHNPCRITSKADTDFAKTSRRLNMSTELYPVKVEFHLFSRNLWVPIQIVRESACSLCMFVATGAL